MNSRAVGLISSALALLVAALSTGARVYYLLFGTLLFMALLGFSCAFAALRLFRVACSAPKREALRGDTVALSFVIRRPFAIPVSRTALHVASTQDEGAVSKMQVRPGLRSGRELGYALKCPHRGKYEVGPIRVEVTDIFGCFTLRKAIRGASSAVEVRPRVYAVSPILLDPGDIGPQARIKMTEDAASPSDVRSWAEGDGLKKIHWKLSMRKRELMVRTFEETARPDTLILPDVSPIHAIRSHALDVEDAICEAALSIALAQLKADHPVRMPLASSRPSEPSGRVAADYPRFLEAVSELRFDGAYPYEQFLLLETRRMHRTGGAVLVTSRMTALIADTAMRMRRLGMRIIFVWVTESARGEAMELMTRMELGGVETMRVAPRSGIVDMGETA